MQARFAVPVLFLACDYGILLFFLLGCYLQSGLDLYGSNLMNNVCKTFLDKILMGIFDV